MRFVDRPWFVAGTAVPDWLSVADRHVRMRERYVRPHVEAEGPLGEVAAGIAQHLHDDDWFHASDAFHVVSARLGAMFRDAIGTDGFRCGFLGHVAMEMLLDTVLIRRDDTALDRYYGALDAVDPAGVQQAVNTISHRGETTRLGEFITMFREIRFLADYTEPTRLLYRLNQVQRRVRLPELPESVIDVLQRGEELVAESAGELLPW